MKKIILLTVLLFANVQFSVAQNTIAKLKFEEAEEAYTNNDFELCLTKLKEVETMLKSTNPRILYLQILAQTKIIERNPLEDYDIIESAKKSINKYLMDYDNLPDNEDKYREIYKISESSKKFLITRQEFDHQLNQIKLDNEAIKIAEIKRINESQEKIIKDKQGEETFMNYVYIKNYEIGLSLKDAKLKYVDFFSNSTSEKRSNDPTYNKAFMNQKYYPGLSYHSLGDKLTGYFTGFNGGDQVDSSFTKSDTFIEEFVNDLTVKFNFSPTKGLNDKSRAGYYNNYIIYIWEKNGKKILLQYHKTCHSNVFTTSILLHQQDGQVLK